MSEKTVAVIGAGSMGHGIAQTALQAGFKVNLYDLGTEQLRNGKDKIYEGLSKMQAREVFTAEKVSQFKENLHTTMDLKEAITDAEFVFEAVPEVLDIKQKVFKQLDELTSSNVVLATNTSSISITEISKVTQHKERVVGVHFFIPVVIMEVVEVIRGHYTSNEVMQEAFDMCVTLGKTPVRVEKDRPGFIINRVNAPVHLFLNSVVEEGWAKPEEVDALMRYNNLPIGLFELADYIGLDTGMFVSEYLEKALHSEYKPSKLLVDKVRARELGRKTGKGFYDWSKGSPKVDVNKRTDAIRIEDIEFVKFNEAAKLIEEEVATLEDIDQAMLLGTGYPEGPITYVKRFDLSQIIDRLQELSERLNLTVLQPTTILQKDPEAVGF